jgi:Ca2+-binding RTX toxin-like protein
VVIQTGDGNDVVTLALKGAGKETATVELGAGDDKITLANDTGAGDILSIIGGDGTDTVDLNGSNISLGSITLSGVTHILDSDGTGVVDGSLLTGKSYTIQGNGSLATQLDVSIATAGTYDFSGLVLDNTLTAGIGGLDITGSAGNDTIIGTAGADAIATNGGNDTITGGKGQDTITLGAGNDTVVIASGDAGKTATTIDIINDFLVAGTDKLKLGTAGSATNYTEVDLASGADSTVANALAAADAAMDGTVRFVLVEDSTATGGEITTANSILFIDFNLDGTADAGVMLMGVLSADIDFGDIIA